MLLWALSTLMARDGGSAGAFAAALSMLGAALILLTTEGRGHSRSRVLRVADGRAVRWSFSYRRVWWGAADAMCPGSRAAAAVL